MPYYFNTEKVSNEYLSINNCGEEHVNDRDLKIMRPNGRVDFSLYYIAEGKCFYEADGIIKEATEGTVLLCFPNVRQHYFFDREDNTDWLWVHFTGALSEKLNEIKKDTVFPIEITNKREFNHIFRSMISGFNIKEPQYEIATAGYMQVLLSYILKNATDDCSRLTKSKHRDIEAVINDMYLNFRKPVDLKKYAETCCVSQSRFMHIFKDHTGVSPYRFQLNIRIDRAIELLRFSDVSVAECAYEVGFSDSSYFCRIFKKITGSTPKRYKNGLK